MMNRDEKCAKIYFVVPTFCNQNKAINTQLQTQTGFLNKNGDINLCNLVEFLPFDVFDFLCGFFFFFHFDRWLFLPSSNFFWSVLLLSIIFVLDNRLSHEETACISFFQNSLRFNFTDGNKLNKNGLGNEHLKSEFFYIQTLLLVFFILSVSICLPLCLSLSVSLSLSAKKTSSIGSFKPHKPHKQTAEWKRNPLNCEYVVGVNLF